MRLSFAGLIAGVYISACALRRPAREFVELRDIENADGWDEQAGAVLQHSWAARLPVRRLGCENLEEES